MTLVVNRYGAIIHRPGALPMLGTSLLGRMPQGMSALSVLLLVRTATNSYAAAGAAVGASALAAALCGPVAGRLIDRFGGRMVVAPAAVGQAGAYVLLVVAAGMHMGAAALIACATLAGALQPPIAPVVRTMLRSLFDDHAVREAAYGLEAIAQETIWIVGPLVVTVLITVASARVAVLMLGVVELLGTALFLRSPLIGGHPRRARQRARSGSALASADLRWLLLPVAMMGFGLGAVEVGIPSLALHDGSRSASGYLLALWSLGSMLGGVRYGATAWRAPVGTRYVILMFANALSIVPLIVAGSIPVAAFAAFIAGMAIAPAFSCQYSLVGRVVVSGTEYEGFSWVLSALIAGSAGGAALGGAMIGPFGVMAPFALACGSALAGALASVRFRGRFANVASVDVGDDCDQPESHVEEVA
ncbi:MAG: MFS transporter [Solirubrobacteraceae bacterium]